MDPTQRKQDMWIPRTWKRKSKTVRGVVAVAWAVAISSIWGCKPTTPISNSSMKETNPTEQLARDLVEGKYGTFFNYYDHEETIDRIWSVEANRPLLYDLVQNEELDGKARFLAAEVLFSREFTFLSKVDPSQVAALYCEALVQNHTGMANSWGLLYEMDDAGPLGSRLTTMGEAARPALIQLLDNSDPGPPLCRQQGSHNRQCLPVPHQGLRGLLSRKTNRNGNAVL